MECIILAGGLGTRLRGVIGEQPKCMAPVNGKPFLYYLFKYLIKQQCTHVILSLGYKHEAILDWLASQQIPFPVDYVVEEEPLGTGGGIKLALETATANEVIVLNGDTFFPVEIMALIDFHKSSKAATTLSLKQLDDFDRYGTVSVNQDHIITSFHEKKHCTTGLINGGVYCIERQAFFKKNFGEKFSFEKDYLEAYTNEQQFFGFRSDAYFIDIGIPTDYDKAQTDFKQIFG